jgi:hypothetical protein
MRPKLLIYQIDARRWRYRGGSSEVTDVSATPAPVRTRRASGDRGAGSRGRCRWRIRGGARAELHHTSHRPFRTAGPPENAAQVRVRAEAHTLNYQQNRDIREFDLFASLEDKQLPAGTPVGFSVEERFLPDNGHEIPNDQVAVVSCVTQDQQNMKVELTIDPKGVPPGLYRARLNVDDARFDSALTEPVSVTVVLKDNRGWVVGLGVSPTNLVNAFLWRRGVMTRLTAPPAAATARPERSTTSASCSAAGRTCGR